MAPNNSNNLANVIPMADISTQPSFFDLYLEYTHDTEVPVFFSRWAALAGIGAYLGRGLSFSHGHFNLQPNLYCMLIGQPATRKSTAVKLIKNLLIKAGYNTVAADKTTKEKFLLDLSGYEGEDDPTISGNKSKREVSLDTLNLFGDECDQTDKEMFIAADEFNDFFGNGNIEFASLLGSLWDYNGVYRNRIKNGKSVSIYNPTISILGGNTPTGFSLAFPTEILGQGFFSRLLLIYGEPRGNRITFPKPPDQHLTVELINFLQYIKIHCRGELEVTPSASKLLDLIYQSDGGGVDDVRFDTYNNRRFIHLLKLCIVVCAAHASKKLTEKFVILANTILTHTEHLMPRALGEFGKAKHADTIHKVMTLLQQSHKPMSLAELWKYVVQDLDKMSDLADILRNLTAADKVQTVDRGFLPKRKPLVEVSNSMVDYTLLNREEI